MLKVSLLSSSSGWWSRQAHGSNISESPHPGEGAEPKAAVSQPGATAAMVLRASTCPSGCVFGEGACGCCASYRHTMFNW